ncbi:MAG: DUF448 domain-containing protein [Betaproteobacteria bacterium]
MKRQPERTCVGCRNVLTKDEVVRIVAGPDGVLIDYREKLPGRGAYVCPKQECIANALAKETLAKALRLKARPPSVELLASHLAAAIKEKIRSLLSISMKAGKIAAGYSAVNDALEKGRVKLLLFASDISDGTRDKIESQSFESFHRATLFTRDEFGSMLNRELIGVVGILDQGLADALWNETQRLKGLINISN